MTALAQAHRTHQHRRYRLTCVEYTGRLERTGGRCEICGTPGPSSAHRQLYIDHDARRGSWAVRGLLCGTCNTRIAHPAQMSMRDRAYLSGTSWIAELCATAGRPQSVPEPDPAAIVVAGPRRRPFRNVAGLWQPGTGPSLSRAWRDVHYYYGPREILVGLPRERVRQICRAAGIDPA